MRERAAELNPALVDGIMAYVRREGGSTAVAAVRDRVSLLGDLAADASHRVDAHRFAELLRAAEDVLAQPDVAERIGRALHEVLSRDVVATLMRSAQRIPVAYSELPHVAATFDQTCTVEVEFAGARRVIVRFYPEHGPLPDELIAFHRGVVASVPGFLNLPLATVRDLPPSNGEAHAFEAH